MQMLNVCDTQLPWLWQVVALVTEGAQRPELPAPEDLPGTGTFAGYSEYIMLMEQCWDQDPAARPTFAQVNPLATLPAQSAASLSAATFILLPSVFIKGTVLYAVVLVYVQVQLSYCCVQPFCGL